MPAELLNDPPGIACEFSDGRQKRWLSDGAGDPALVADLLAGLAGQVHPHGTVNAPGTVDSYLIGLRDIAVFMTGRGVRGGAIALTRAVLAEYWMQAGGMRESTTRAMLAGYDTATGALDPGVRALVTAGVTPRGRRTIRWCPMTSSSGSGCGIPAGGSPMTLSPPAGGRWRPRPPARTRGRPGGAETTCAGCWCTAVR